VGLINVAGVYWLVFRRMVTPNRKGVRIIKQYNFLETAAAAAAAAAAVAAEEGTPIGLERLSHGLRRRLGGWRGDWLDTRKKTSKGGGEEDQEEKEKKRKKSREGYRSLSTLLYAGGTGITGTWQAYAAVAQEGIPSNSCRHCSRYILYFPSGGKSSPLPSPSRERMSVDWGGGGGFDITKEKDPMLPSLSRGGMPRSTLGVDIAGGAGICGLQLVWTSRGKSRYQ